MRHKNGLLLNFIKLLLTPFTYQFNLQLQKNGNVKKIISLYQNNNFLKIRFWDAPFLEVEALIPKKGAIVDLGCGDGFFANFLAVSSGRRDILGIEINSTRISDADKGLKNIRFLQRDITKTKLSETDTILLFHVLHHLNSYKEQEKLLKNCFEKIKSGGRLFVVEVEPKLSYKYLAAWLTDHFIVPWIFEKRFYSSIYFRRSKEWVNLLSNIGFNTQVFNLEQGKPFSHVLIACKKEG